MSAPLATTRRPSRCILMVLSVGLLIASASSASASERVLVLMPDRFQVDEGLVDDMHAALEEAVSRHPDYELESFEAQTLVSMSEAVGCFDDRDTCLGIIGETLEVDIVVFGEIGGADRTVLAELTLWDVNAAEARRTYSRAVEGDGAELSSWIPVLARGAIYGDVGRIRLRVTPPGALVRLDAQRVRGGPEYDLEGLALGPHVIDVAAPGFFDQREVVRVDLDTVELDIELVPTTVEVGVTSGRLWTWVALGTALASTGAGVAFGLASQSTQDAFDSEATQPRVDLGELEALQDTGESQAMLSNVFFGVGAASMVAAVVLFFVEGGEEAAPTGAGRAARAGDLLIGPNTLGVRF